MSELDPTQQPQKVAGRMAEWLDPLAKIGAIFAVLFAIQQYLDRQAQARVERTLDYVSLYVDGGGAVALAQREVSLRLTRAASVLRRFHDDLAERPDDAHEARRRFILGLLYGTNENPGLLEHQIVLLHFYGSVEACVATLVCDEDTALAFFEVPATDYWQNFCTVILTSRDLDPDWGNGVEALVARTAWQPPAGLGCQDEE